MRAVIFSKDRPLQLECLLRSMKEHCNIFDTVVVLYKTSMYEAYEILKMDYPEVIFRRERNFKQDFLSLIMPGYNCLLVDDDIFFRDVLKHEVYDMLTECDIGSLRLGNNIKHKKHFHVRSSVDGNIFRGDLLKKLADDRFKNPNQLEIALNKYCLDSTMAWFNEPRLIGVPNNRVSDSSGCAHMNGDISELENAFLQGFRIDYKQMNLECDNVHINEKLCLSPGQQ